MMIQEINKKSPAFGQQYKVTSNNVRTFQVPMPNDSLVQDKASEKQPVSWKNVGEVIGRLLISRESAEHNYGRVGVNYLA